MVIMKSGYLIIAAACMALTACKKIYTEQPDFDVHIMKTSYHVNDTILFSFSGSADNIVFYSGMPGSNYDYANRTEAAGVPQLQFTSYLQNKGELNTLRLLGSTDFKGQYDSTGIAAASWTDITSRAVFSSGSDNTASGIVDLSDFITADNKPVYLAFKYLGYASNTLKQPAWTIRTFNVQNLLPEGNKLLIGSIDLMLWKAVDIKNPTTVWVPAATGQATINGSGSASANIDNEDWLISKEINLRKVTPDVGVSIQDIASAKLSGYSYIATVAGTYTVTFAGINRSVNQEKKIVRRFQITIVP